MSKREILAGATDQTIDVFIQDSSSTVGAGLTGLAFNTSNLTCYYRKGATGTPTALTLATQTVGGAHSDGGFVAVDGTNCPGQYRLDLSDTIVASAGMVTLYLRGAANMVPCVAEIEVVSVNKFDAVRGGMTALPNAAADAAGGLPISDAGGLDLDNRMPAAAAITNLNTVYNTDFATNYDATNDRWTVNVKTWNDLVTVALPLVPTTAGRTLDVSAAGNAGVDWANVENPTTTVDLTNTTIAITQKVDLNTIKTQTVTCAAGVTIQATIANQTDLTAALADTNELQTDWANDGRLDLLLDAAVFASQNAATYSVNIGTNGSGLSEIPWNAAWDAEVQSEVQDAIEVNNLDHLLKVAVTGGDVIDNSVIAKIASKSATADWDTFVNTTDSLEAIRDRGDAAWTTGEGGGGGASTVVVQPLQTNIDERVSEATIQAYYNETGWTIGPVTVLDANNDPVDLTAYDSLKLIIQDQYGTDLFVTTSVTVSGDDDNQWTATGTSAVTQTVPARHKWALRGINTSPVVNVVLGRGDVTVSQAAEEDE